MGKWAALLGEKISAPLHIGTVKTDKTPLLSVLAVAHGGGAEKFSAPPMVAANEASPYHLSPELTRQAHAKPWDDAVIERFTARAFGLMRRGFVAAAANDLALRLHVRDVQGDDRRLCLECGNLAWRPPNCGRCRKARAAGVGAALPTELMALMQRCPAYQPVEETWL